ncbi:translocation/assembly module TamB [Segetibacter sp. 3557_3]|nr:translocation/assembly module TamB [Segetibacter sp. 3557_3]
MLMRNYKHVTVEYRIMQEKTKQPTQKRSVLAKIGRGLAIFVISLIGLVVLLLILIQTAPVQNFARKKIVAFLENKLDTRVAIGRLDIDFPKMLVLEDVYFEDRTKDTLLAGHQLKVDLDMFKLIKSEIQINEINLNGITAKIKRQLPDTTFNFQFIVDAFAPATPTTPAKPADTAAMKMAIDKIIIDKTRLVYRDVLTGNDMDLSINHFDTRIKTFDPTNLRFEIPTINLDGFRGYITQTKPLEVQTVNTAPVDANTGATTAPKFLQLVNKELLLSNLDLAYNNETSALSSHFKVDRLNVYPREINLEKTAITLDRVILNKLDGFVKMGKTGKESDIVKVTNQNDQEVPSESLPLMFRVNNIELNQNNLRFDDASKPVMRRGMDYGHMDIKDLTLHANSFVFSNDSIAANITEGRMKEKSGFILNKFEVNFAYTDKGARLEDLLIQTPGTTIQRSAVIRYPSLASIQKNIGLLEMDIDLANTKIQVKDILLFAPQLAAQPAFSQPSQTLYVNSRISGSVARLHIDRFQASGIGNTKVDVAGYIYGLPDPKKVSADLAIRNFSTTRRDIMSFVPPNTIPNNITVPENIAANGTIKGNPAKMLANLAVNTSLGSVKVNGSIANTSNPKAATYNAQIAVNQLNLGTIMQNQKQMGRLTASFNVNGRGFDPKTANAAIKGTIISADINKYIYRNLRLDAGIANQQFRANASMADPNLNFSLAATGSMAGKYPGINLNATIDSVNTKALNFTPDAIIYHGNIIADFPELNPDALAGSLFVTNSVLLMNGQRLVMDSISMLAGYENGNQTVDLKTDFVNARLDGNFKLTQLGNIIQQSIQPYFAVIPASKPIPTDPYNLNVNVSIVNHPTLQGFAPELTRMDPVTLTGNFSNTSGWKADLNAPLIVYGTNTISGVALNAATEGNALRIATNVGQLSSGTNLAIYATSLNATLANNQLVFDLNIKDKSLKDKYRLGGSLAQQNGNTYLFSLAPDNLMLNYANWSANAGNLIRYDGKDINASNFAISQGNQQLSINSTSPGANSPMQVGFSNFRIATLTGFVQQDSLLVDGLVNGNVLLKDLLTLPSFTTDLTINDLAFKKDTIGNVNVKVNNNTQNVFATDVTITGRGNDVGLTGNYYLKPNNQSNFDMNLNIRQLPFSTIEAFSMGALNQSSGNLTGQVAIKGTVASPDIDGAINFNNTAFNVVMLGSYFRIDNEAIKINNQGIGFDTFTIRDSANNSLVVDGMAYTTDFTKYRFDMTVRARNFRGLNSVKQPNSLYYGQLFFNSNLQIKGTESAPSVDGSLRINEDTRLSLVLPQSEPGVVDREGVIEFVDMDAPETDSLFKATLAKYDTSFNSSGVTGFDISANIEIVKEAEFNLIVDEGNGDFLMVKGAALLNGGIDPSGKITMTGNYEVEQGAYELSFNFLRRRFEIQKGSTITWTGEPTQGNLDVTAVYVANTSAWDLVKDQESETAKNIYLQKLPFQVKLIMKGELLRPQLTFDIGLPTENMSRFNVASINTINTRLDQLKTEPSELNKQVFALLLLNRFVSENPFESSSGGGFNAGLYARQSVSKILTEQLNNLAGDLIAGVDINFDVNSSEDYTSGEQRTRTDFNVALSKRLLNDRLKVTVGNNFELEGPQQSQEGANSIAGNISIDYMLSKDGKYMLRGYRKNEYEAIVQGFVVETGLRFIMSVDYNTFKEIFRPGRRLRRNNRNNNNQQSTPAAPAEDRSTTQDLKSAADNRKTIPATDKDATDEY